MKKYLLPLAAGCITACAMAQTTFLCPNTMNYVKAGDRITDVLAACGSPAQTHVPKPKHYDHIERWGYEYIYPRAIRLNITMRNGEVVRISLNGNPTRSTTLCGPNHPINVGENMAQVVGKCGHPRYVDQISPPPFGPLHKPGTQLIYKGKHYLPDTVFYFQEGRLQDVRLAH